MSTDHLYFRWSQDPDGRLWVQHGCQHEVHTFRAPPPWQVVADGVAPSFNCMFCHHHVILGPADRVPWESIEPAATPEVDPDA